MKNAKAGYITAHGAVLIRVLDVLNILALQEYPGDDRASATERYIGGKTDDKDKSFAQKDIVKNTLECNDGFITIPNDPGIGVELIEGAAQKFPYERRKIVTRLHIDGSVVDQ